MSTTQKAVKRTPEEWRSTISECRKSGLSDAEWCRRNGIPPSSMYNAIGRLRKLACSIPERAAGNSAAEEGKTSPRQDVVPVGVIPELPVTAAKAASPAAHLDNLPVIEIQSSHLCIRVCSGADPGMLSTVLHSLGELLC